MVVLISVVLVLYSTVAVAVDVAVDVAFVVINDPVADSIRFDSIQFELAVAISFINEPNFLRR